MSGGQFEVLWECYCKWAGLLLHFPTFARHCPTLCEQFRVTCLMSVGSCKPYAADVIFTQVG